MSEITEIIRQTLESLENDELIEITALSITVQELEKCVQILDGLGGDVADAKAKVEAIVERLTLKKEIGYTWGIENVLYRYIITSSENAVADYFKDAAPNSKLKKSEVKLLHSLMLNYRRKTIKAADGRRVLEILKRIHGNTELEDLRDALEGIHLCLQAHLGGESGAQSVAIEYLD